MTTKKPKTALARLLDNISQIDRIEGSEVGHSLVEEITPPLVEEKKPEIISVPAEDATREINVQYIDPKVCRPWEFADRPDDEMGNIEELADSIKRYGQQEPVLVRPVHTSRSVQYEIVFGNRRWRACQLAGEPMLSIIKPVTDQEASVYQKEENEKRKDLSDLARARSYKAQLDAGIFTSEAEMSKCLDISRKTLNDLMAFLRIPDELASAIPSFKHLTRAMAVKLATLSKDKTILYRLIELGPKIGKKIVTTSNIEKFIYQTENTTSPTKNEKIEIKDPKGFALFNMTTNAKGATTIKINQHISHQYDIHDLKDVIYQYLMKKEGALDEP